MGHPIIIIVGMGTIIGQVMGLWAIDNGCSKVFVAPADMLLADPQVGGNGVLTYEFRGGSSRRACFRAADDPAVRDAVTEDGQQPMSSSSLGGTISGTVKRG